MTALHMSAKDFKRLTKNIPPKGMGKGDAMHLHLLLVEAAHGKLTQDELRSARFTESRKTFVSWLMGWTPGKEK